MSFIERKQRNIFDMFAYGWFIITTNTTTGDNNLATLHIIENTLNHFKNT